MSKTFASLIMGLILISLGILFFLNNMDIIWLEGEFVGAAILFVLGFSFLLYIFADRKLWWPLIPSIILFALSAIALLSYFDIEAEWLWLIYLLGVGLAFLAVYIKDRKNVWSLIPAWLAIVLGFVVLVEHLEDYISWLESGLGGSVFFLGAALAFFVYYIKKRKEWWPLFISLLCLTLAGVVAVGVVTDHEPIAGSVFLWGAGLAFLAIYIKDRKNVWSLIPAWLAVVLGFVVLVEHLEDYIYWLESGLGGSVFFLGAALAFFVYYIKKRREWWPLFISLMLFTLAGVVAVGVTSDYEELAGSVVLWGAGISFLSIFIKKQAYWWSFILGGILLVLGIFPMMAAFDWGWDILYAFILFFGIGLVFGVLSFIKIKGRRLSWAIKPSMILIGFSFFLLFFTPEVSILQIIFPLFLVGLGITLIAKYLLQKKHLKRI